MVVVGQGMRGLPGVDNQEEGEEEAAAERRRLGVTVDLEVTETALKRKKEDEGLIV